jgi:hypothetical protein
MEQTLEFSTIAETFINAKRVTDHPITSGRMEGINTKS